jgi:hypothetical protein
MGWLSRITGRDAAAAQAALIERQTAVISKLVRARYDAAQTTPINQRHWAMADGYSADAALSPEIRRKLRNRARLERDNNPYLAGMVQTLASDLVGTGPRLALTVPGEPAPDVVGRVEEAVYEWGQRTDLARKLRVMKMAKAVDGESIGVLFTNRRLTRPPSTGCSWTPTETSLATGFCGTTRGPRWPGGRSTATGTTPKTSSTGSTPSGRASIAASARSCRPLSSSPTCGGTRSR